MQARIPEADRSYFTRLLADIVSEATNQGRACKGAWAKQRILRQIPNFSEMRWGLPDFRSFIESLGGFEIVDQPGSDISIRTATDRAVIQAKTPSSQPPEIPANAPVRVAPDLWRAAIRPESSPAAFLDKEALEAGRLVIVYADPVGGERETQRYRLDPARRYIEIPPSSTSQQTEWLIAWARANLSPDLADAVIAASADSRHGLANASTQLAQHGALADWHFHRARLTTQALKTWAQTNGVAWAPPAIEIFSRGDQSSVPPRLITTPSLRDLTLQVVARMSDDELRELRLPVGLIFDALKGR